MKASVSPSFEKSTSRTSRMARMVDRRSGTVSVYSSSPPPSPRAVLLKHSTDRDLLAAMPKLIALVVSTTGGVSSW
jgi:hypothetical protein